MTIQLNHDTHKFAVQCFEVIERDNMIAYFLRECPTLENPELLAELAVEEFYNNDSFNSYLELSSEAYEIDSLTHFFKIAQAFIKEEIKEGVNLWSCYHNALEN